MFIFIIMEEAFKRVTWDRLMKFLKKRGVDFKV